MCSGGPENPPSYLYVNLPVKYRKSGRSFLCHILPVLIELSLRLVLINVDRPYYPSWDGPSVVCYLFLYLFICAPTIAFTLLSTFCTLHLSSTFYLSQDTLWVQGFIFEGDLQFSKLFKVKVCAH